MGRESHLGLFVPFARAYGRADALTRAQVEAAGRSYEARLITEDTYLQRISDILQVPLRTFAQMAYRDQWSHEGGFKGHQAHSKRRSIIDPLRAERIEESAGYIIDQRRRASMAALARHRSSYAANLARSMASYTGTPPRPARCGGILIDSVPRLLTEMAWRHSWRRSKREAAYRACRMMIQFREAALCIGVYSLDNAAAQLLLAGGVTQPDHTATMRPTRQSEASAGGHRRRRAQPAWEPAATATQPTPSARRWPQEIRASILAHRRA